MKTWISRFFFLLLIIAWPLVAVAIQYSCNNPYEEIGCQFNMEDKIYIELDRLYFFSNQIYVKIANELIPIQCLSSDRDGIFISIQQIRTGCARQGTWKCENCGYENYVGIHRCGVCGELQGKNKTSLLFYDF